MSNPRIAVRRRIAYGSLRFPSGSAVDGLRDKQQQQRVLIRRLSIEMTVVVGLILHLFFNCHPSTYRPPNDK